MTQDEGSARAWAASLAMTRKQSSSGTSRSSGACRHSTSVCTQAHIINMEGTGSQGSKTLDGGAIAARGAVLRHEQGQQHATQVLCNHNKPEHHSKQDIQRATAERTESDAAAAVEVGERKQHACALLAVERVARVQEGHRARQLLRVNRGGSRLRLAGARCGGGGFCGGRSAQVRLRVGEAVQEQLQHAARVAVLEVEA